MIPARFKRVRPCPTLYQQRELHGPLIMLSIGWHHEVSGLFCFTSLSPLHIQHVCRSHDARLSPRHLQRGSQGVPVFPSLTWPDKKPVYAYAGDRYPPTDWVVDHTMMKRPSDSNHDILFDTKNNSFLRKRMFCNYGADSNIIILRMERYGQNLSGTVLRRRWPLVRSLRPYVI